MKNRKQLLFYILVNIIVSAVTTLLVLWIWDKPNRSQVVDAPLGPVVEDRDGPLGRLRVGDRLTDHGLEELVSEALLERLSGLACMPGPHVGDVEHDAEKLQIWVQALARELEDLHRLLHALQGEVLGLG